MCAKYWLLVGAQNTFSKKGNMIQRSHTKLSDSCSLEARSNQFVGASNEDEHEAISISRLVVMDNDMICLVSCIQ